MVINGDSLLLMGTFPLGMHPQFVVEKWSVWFEDLPVETGGFPLQTLKLAEGINAWSV